MVTDVPSRPPINSTLQAKPGDTLRLAPGEYWETVITKTAGYVVLTKLVF